MEDAIDERRDLGFDDPGEPFSSPSLSTGPDQAHIAGWTIERYVSSTRWPVLFVAALAAVLYYIQAPQAVAYGLEIVSLGLIGWGTAARGNRRNSLVAGMIGGLTLGLIIAVVRLLLDRSLISALNILVEPVITALFGGLISVIATTLRQLIQR